MMTILSIVVFLGAFTAAASVIALSIAPQWRRIVRLAMGNVEQPFAQRGAFAYADRRSAIRRGSPASLRVLRLREAA